MRIGDISSVNHLLSNEKNIKNESRQVFEDIYKAAIGQLEETNSLQKQSEQLTTDFAAGKTDNIADVLIASKKATIAIQYTVRLRDKLMDAYNEIMRMQV